MKHNQYKINSNVWLYPGMAGWHFASVPQDVSEDIKNHFGDRKRGWGSLPVMVTILRPRSGQVGKTSWKTSIFPNKKTGGYLLPLKTEVRKKEGGVADDTIKLLLEVII